MFENVNRTSIEELGEFGLIEHLSKPSVERTKNTLVGIGDDAAVIEKGDELLVVTTDMLIEQVHFDLMYTPLKHLGYKAVASNISDICAMNAEASHITISVALSSKFSLEAVEELYQGIYLACDKYGVDLIGGDTSSSNKGLYMSVTALGKVTKDKLTKRSGAEEGDLLCVSGDIGGAYMGLQLLEREKRIFLEHPEMQPDLKDHDYIVGRQLKSEARVDIVKHLDSINVVPSSMIDISDGLASEVFHLSKASNVSFAIHEDKLPIDQDTYNMAMEFGIDPTTAALNGGEDYELLFTLKQADYDKIKNDMDISVIGYAREIGLKNQLISKQKKVHDLQAQGWQAFKKD